MSVLRASPAESLLRRSATAPRTGGEPRPIDRSSKLYETCVEFEALFLKQMLSAMRKTVPEGGLLDSGFAGEVFEDMLYDEYAKTMARNAGFGLADTIYQHLSMSQSAAISTTGGGEG
jgi:flagellar protein FlgJ